MRLGPAAVLLWVVPVLAWGQNSGAAESTAPSDRHGRLARLEQALHGGARHASRVLLDENGMARGDYDIIGGRWEPYEPAWHTGQLILGLLEANRVAPDPEYLAAAKRAGDWWVSQELKGGGPLEGLLNAWHGGPLGRLINFTTIADGTPGLFALSRATGDARYADTATRSGRWLVTHTYVPEARLFYNIIDPGTGEVWRDRSPHHPDVKDVKITHVARPNTEGSLLKDMCRHTGERRYCDLFLEVSRAKVARQHESGFWMEFEPNEPREGRVHPRFNVWYAEALLEAYELDPDPRFLQAALRTARGMSRLQRRDGSIFYDNFIDGRARESSPTGSAVAFAGLLWLRLHRMGASTEFLPNIERSAEWLLANRFAETHADTNLRGGFFEVRLRTRAVPARLEYRDISTAFALRFLAAYHDHLREPD